MIPPGSPSNNSYNSSLNNSYNLFNFVILSSVFLMSELLFLYSRYIKSLKANAGPSLKNPSLKNSSLNNSYNSFNFVILSSVFLMSELFFLYSSNNKLLKDLLSNVGYSSINFLNNSLNNSFNLFNSASLAFQYFISDSIIIIFSSNLFFSDSILWISSDSISFSSNAS